jgi:hypothetical protein
VTPDTGFLEPAYGDHSLVDVLPALGRALGATVDGATADGLHLPEASSYVLFVVDGLGHELLAAHADEAPFLHSLLAGSAPATAGVPSTTATSLTSLGTGLMPGTHGVVGFTTRIPGTDDLLNALFWSKSVDPEVWQPHPTYFARLQAAGVQVTQVNKREFASSGLTTASSRGVDFVGADRVGERLVAAQRASETSPSLAYVYDGDLDWTGHRYGVDSPQWRAQLTAVDHAAEQLRDALDPATRLLVTADHGMVDATPDSRHDVDETPALREGVAVLGGEARFRHIYCQYGAAADVHATWRELLGDRALVLTRDEAMGRGWFGEVDSEVLPRIGDVVAAAHENHVVLSSVDFPYEMRLIGMHGSLTPVEMLVPVLVA